MNRLLVFLGAFSLIVGALFVLMNGYFTGNAILNENSTLSKTLFSSTVLSFVILGLGFIRFNKLIGVVTFIIGGISLLTDLSILPWRIIPVSFLPLITIALGARFLLIGYLSGENKED